MRLHTTCAWISMLLMSVAAQAQQGEPPQQPASTAVERTSPTGPLPSRATQTRSSSGGRESVVEVVELHRLSGRLEPVEETRTETARTGPTATQSVVERYGFAESRRPFLVEKRQTDRETSANGTTHTVERAWVPDVNGSLGPVVQQVESTSSVTPEGSRSETVVRQRGPGGTLEERERTEHTSRRDGAGIVREETTQRLRDLNGGWQSTETRSLDVRGAGTGQTIEEEVVQRPDLNGRLTLTERNVTRRSRTDGRDEAVTETYSQEPQGSTASSAPLRLTRRVRSSTTKAADGGRSTVEEVEARNLVSAGDSLRVVQRTVVTERRIGPNRWSTERQVFELDANGRMSLVATESEETTEK